MAHSCTTQWSTAAVINVQFPRTVIYLYFMASTQRLAQLAYLRRVVS